MANAKDMEKAKAIEELKTWRLRPGEMVYTILRHCSPSGMQRAISVIILRNGKPYELSWLVGKALGLPHDQKHTGIKIGGSGMDMGFHIVYELSHRLWPKGHKCIGDKCPSNDHSNGDLRSHHPDGGYALRHSWL